MDTINVKSVEETRRVLLGNITQKCRNSSFVLAPTYDAEFVIASISLIVIIAAVLFGNILVVAAVLTTRKLRTVTNIFIVNLACADLCLGIFVLPFSAALEVLHVWVFGVIWCHVWLAVDVWLCTASIFNLCCISLDRYLAITQPMKYHGLMSEKRGKILVAVIWVVSFVICFPPLIGWNEGGGIPFEPSLNDDANMSFIDFEMDTNGTYFLNTPFTIFEISPTQSTSEPSCIVEPYACELTNAQGYRIYASMGSFYLPMLVMVFFYIRIYRAAVKTISAYEKGVLTTKANGETSNLNRQKSVTLRVHRGGCGSASNKAVISKSVSSDISPTKSCEHSSLRRERSFQGEAYSSSSPVNQPKYQRRFRTRYQNSQEDQKDSATKETEFNVQNDNYLTVNNNGVVTRQGSTMRNSKESRRHVNGTRIRFTGGKTSGAAQRRNQAVCQRTGKNLKAHVRKFNREKKAAKTLAIIVGAFIVCWLPFFLSVPNRSIL